MRFDVTAFSPSRMRRATAAAIVACPARMHWTADDALAEKSHRERKIGALATEESREKRAVAFVGHSCRIDIHQCQKMALCGGRLAASFRMSSNDKFVVPSEFARGRRTCCDLATSFRQNVSLGEAPINDCDCLCVGQYVQDIFDEDGIVVASPLPGIVLGQLVVVDATSLYQG